MSGHYMGTPMSVPLSSPAILFPSALPCRMGNFSESLGRAQRTFAIYKCFVVSLVFAVLVWNAIFVIGICIFYFSPCRISTFGKNESTSSSVINPVRVGRSHCCLASRGQCWLGKTRFRNIPSYCKSLAAPPSFIYPWSDFLCHSGPTHHYVEQSSASYLWWTPAF